MAADVGLFVTCLVDLFRPGVARSAAALIEEAGFSVEAPAAQTCCGQPAYNAGDRAGARRIARTAIAAFEGFDHVVAPSGSCAAVVKRHYPALFDGAPQWAGRARELAARTHELTAFLVDVAGWRPAGRAAPSGRIAYHDSCSGLRELGIRAQPRALLGALDGLDLAETEDPEVCCGFGGAFCVKYPAVSEAMADARIRAVEAAGADHLLAGDLGCLLHLSGRLARRGAGVELRHVAEALAGAGGPAIAAPARNRR